VKYVIVAGGVLSGLGKGITSASLGLLLQSRGVKTTLVKCDMYLNIDAGTMNPVEHGEVFVTEDGLETDQDIGHYERFLGTSLSRVNYMTNGQIYQTVLNNERALAYGGRCVEPYHSLPPEITKRWDAAGRATNADLAIIELGGTVGEYEGLLFYEAVRRLRLKKPNDVVLILVGYLPTPASIGELKSKPLQQAVTSLNSLGLHPDFIVARAEKKIDTKRKEKISLASGVPIAKIIANPDVDSIYEIPLILQDQKMAEMVAEKLDLKLRRHDLAAWKEMLYKTQRAKRKVRIGLVGKYQKTGDYTLEDSYVCVVESLKHASWKLGVAPELVWIDAEGLEKKSGDGGEKILTLLDGIIIPQGWGSRGSEGKIKAIKYARENKVPFLGLCYGMQMAVIEYARNVAGLPHAVSEEINPRAKHKVIHIMPSQQKYLKKNQYGGTIRLGAWPCKLVPGSKLNAIYKDGKSSQNTEHLLPATISERHRHRYEFNNSYRSRLEKAGMKVSGVSPDGKLVEAIEISDHPFFVGTQFHPEYQSRPLSPHPIFVEFVKAALHSSNRPSSSL